VAVHFIGKSYMPFMLSSQQYQSTERCVLCLTCAVDGNVFYRLFLFSEVGDTVTT